MKPNATWEVNGPTFSQGNGRFNVISPLNGKMTRFNTDVSPLIMTDTAYGEGERQHQKIQQTGNNLCNNLFYSSKDHKCYTSVTSASTNTSGMPSPSEISRKSSSSSRSRKSSSSSRSRKSSSSSRSRPKRTSNRRSASTRAKVAFDPARKPKKSCLKKGPKPSSPTSEKPRRRGSSYKVHILGGGTVKRRRTIRYSGNVAVREFRSSLSLVENDSRVLWWQDDEHVSIKENLQRILARVDKYGVAKTNGRRYCVRGLENFLDPNDCELDRAEAEEAVLLEQDNQRESGTYDDMRIASVYFRFTRTSLQRARKKALEDATNADSIHNEVTSKLRNSLSSGSLNRSLGLPAMASSPVPSALLPRRSASFSVLSTKSSSSKMKRMKPKRSQSFQQQSPVLPYMA